MKWAVGDRGSIPLRIGLLILLLAWYPNGSAGQTTSRVVSGVVTDSAGAPVEAAQVFHEGLAVGGLTNREGAFAVTLPNRDALVLQVQMIGYAPDSIILPPGGDLVVGVTMTSAPVVLERVCTLNMVPAVQLILVDSLTGNSIGIPARGYVRDGSFTESIELRGPSDHSYAYYAAADERPGRYSVVVEAEGYEPWIGGPYQVDDLPCHVDAVRVTVRMRRRTEPSGRAF